MKKDGRIKNVANVSLKALTGEFIKPEPKTSGSVGIDLHLQNDVVLEAGKVSKIPAGFSIELPKGFGARIRSRSSAFLKGLICQGEIDEDFRGEVNILVLNTGKEDLLFSRGDRIAQMILFSTPDISVDYVSELSVTERGAGGFGSTGK
jgi:dUTP pyrophosphatase